MDLHGIPRRKLFNPRLMILLTVVFGLLLLISALLEIRRSRDELTHILREQALSIISLAQLGLNNSAISFGYVEQLVQDKLLDNARFLEKLDRDGLLTDRTIQTIARENDLFRVHVFDRDGRRILSNFFPPGSGRQSNAPRTMLRPILQDGDDELVLGFRQGFFGTGERFAVAKRRQKGGAIVVNMDADQMLAFRREIGVGQFIQRLVEGQGVTFAMVQDTLHLLMASAGITESKALKDDPFLMAAWKDGAPAFRFSHFKDQEVLEVVQFLKLPESGAAMLRIGLTTEHLRQAEHKAQRRVWLISGLLLVVGVLIANVLLGSQNYLMLRQAYARIEGYTGGILANMTDGVIAVDCQRHFIVINRAAEQMFDIRAQDLTGKPCESFQPFCDWFASALRSVEELPAVVHRFDHQGRMLELETRVTVLRDETGKSDMAFAVIKDLTQEKRLQEQIKRQEQLTAMGHLASGVAHEIRNPLNAISIIAQRLRAEFTPVSDGEEYRQLTTTLSQETQRINEIIQQFLQFARPPQLQKSRCSLVEIARRVAALIQPEVYARGLSLNLRCLSVPEIFGDPDKLQQALINLMQNSIHACQKGDEITLSCKEETGGVRIEIQDTGEGIAEENLGKIFNLYYTTRESGSGLGLSIVQQIISLHDGRIEVQSEKGRGTLFTIFLPVKEMDL